MSRRPSTVAIVGATAVGKTRLGLVVAEALGGEIVSVDSRQIYRRMDIGTAKPTPAERARIPHHLISVADPDDTWTLAQYQTAVRAAVEDIVDRGRLPILVGGTGQYMRAVLEGWRPPRRDPAIRARLEAEAERHGGEALAHRLAEVDPASAARIDPRNTRRVVRALEIVEATGAPVTARRDADPPPFNVVKIGLSVPRPDLYRRIDARIDRMIEDGLVDEVRRLIDEGMDRSLPSMSAIGYREIAAHLAGECTLEEAVGRMRRATRRLVRTQANWFRESDPTIQWVTPGDGYEAGVIDWLVGRLRNSGDRASSPSLRSGSG